MDFDRLHTDSRRLLDSLSDRLPPDKLTGYRNLSSAGEWPELLDVLSAGLVKRQIPVTRAERDLLASVLGMVATPAPGYAYINDAEGTLAALTVMDERD